MVLNEFSIETDPSPAIEGDLTDVVVASRIRLARNIADFPFVETCSRQQVDDIETRIRDGFSNDQQLSEIELLENDSLDQLERQFLLELDSITGVRKPDVGSAKSDSKPDSSSENLNSTPDKSIEAEQRQLSVTVNEEDHLRLQILAGGYDLSSAWQRLDELDDLIDNQIQYAFCPQWGYLTACPANVGTGLRASLLLHLPGLSMTGQIEKTIRTLQRSGLVVRGISGDQAWGDFYRISNQSTLGSSEDELISVVRRVVPSIVFHERNARKYLVENRRDEIELQVNRACDALTKTQLQSNEETLYLLSQIRLGANTGVLESPRLEHVRSVLELLQLRKRLGIAVKIEDYQLAAKLHQRILELEGGQS